MTTVAVSRALAEAPDHVGYALLDLTEDQWFDRKSARISARELADSLIGLANADGGWIVVGLHAHAIEGTDTNERRRNEQLQANIDFCVPPVHAHARFLACVKEDGS